ncbi:coiled-coil domain-containing protein 122 [Centroberyx affinis]|uniref:coiled-coil domain-containing protein 122 n=1 Tax=Centroberyx affinis TaxID=166261 RepID=UPI003A5BD7CC
MSNSRASEDETHEKPEFSLTKALEDVSQQGYAQVVALQEKQLELSSLQAILSDVEKRGEEAELELRSKVRQVFTLEGETEHLQRQTRLLHARCTSVYTDNTELRLLIGEEEENARIVLAGYNTYRNKMEGHRTVVLHAESQTEAHKELEEKRALVRRLTHRKETLKEDLENPNGSTVQLAKRGIDDLKGEISVLRKTVAERRERLLKEFGTHNQIKKDIEIQNRRYEAIVKRLHCQLNKAQAIHRQMTGDIYHMERQIAELKRQLKSS